MSGTFFTLSAPVSIGGKFVGDCLLSLSNSLLINGSIRNLSDTLVQVSSIILVCFGTIKTPLSNTAAMPVKKWHIFFHHPYYPPFPFYEQNIQLINIPEPILYMEEALLK